MGRPSKQVVDYFPHDCKHTKTMEILEGRFGNNGYSVWFKLLELLGSAEGHTIDFSDDLLLEHFSSVKCHISATETLEVIDFLARLSAIDPELWENRVVWCQHFVDRLEEVYRKRKYNLPEKPSIRDGNSISASESTDEEGFRRQESTKESKGKESKDIVHLPSSENHIPYLEIITYLNSKTGKHFGEGKETKAHIKARWNSGFTLEDFKRVIDIKCAKWLTDEKMVDYLRPQTLFGTKFEAYLNEGGARTLDPNYDPELGEIR